MPETPESRIARLEEQNRANEYLVRTFAPTARQLGEIATKLEGIVEDLQVVQAWKRDLRVELKELERQLENQINACAQGVGELRREFQGEMERERERREKVQKDFQHAMAQERDLRQKADEARQKERRLEAEARRLEAEEREKSAAILTEAGKGRRWAAAALIIVAIIGVLGSVIQAIIGAAG